jgi:hypothetical protein
LWHTPIVLDEYELSMQGGRPAKNEQAMKKVENDQMRQEYDFSSGIRGKYLPRLAKGANVVVLDRDMAKVFPSSKAVNAAGRAGGSRGRRAKSIQ